MTDKELKRMSRGELLEMLIEQMEDNERLRKELDTANAQLASRRLIIERSGTLAEAALQINQVFEAADKAAQQYLENVRLTAEQRSDA